MTAQKLLALFASVFAFAAVTSSCANPEQVGVPPPAAQKLWGDMKPIVSVKELMRDMIDPGSDYVFDAVGGVGTRRAPSIRGPRPTGTACGSAES
jgi:hypothetical protein